ncbi:MAG: ArsC family reductase [Rickettsiales bacterium]|nr:ArsC family reductase [Rickettsiales bacterium]
MIKIYGIRNCDTVKKALLWLENHNVKYQFHDYKKEGVDSTKIKEFVKKFGWEKILNRKGTTWRLLGEEQKNITDEESAIKLMLEKPSIIKRPIIDLGKNQIIGFDENEYRNFFKK